MKIIGLIGVMGSGKDTVAEQLRIQYDFVVISLADSLKRLCASVYLLPNECLFGASHLRNYIHPAVSNAQYWSDCQERIHKEKQTIQKMFPAYLGFTAYRQLLLMTQLFQEKEKERPGSLTARYILQRIGTEWGRHIKDSVWLDQVKTIVGKIQNEDGTYSREEGFIPAAVKCGGIVIPDCRFENECRMVKELEGTVVWVDASKRVKPTGDTHASEPTIEKFKNMIDIAVDNNYTREDLYSSVERMLNSSTWG